MFASKIGMRICFVAALLAVGVVWVAAQEDGSTTPKSAKGTNSYHEDMGGSPALLPHSYEPVNGIGGEDVSGPYEIVEGWPKTIDPKWRMGGAAGVQAESPNKIYVAVRGEEPIRPKPYVWGADLFTIPGQMRKASGAREGGRLEHMVMAFDREGNLVEYWKQHNKLFGKPNRIFIDPYDPEHPIWVTDSHFQEMSKFTHDGSKRLLVIGEKEAHATPENPFKGQDIAFLPNGEFYAGGLSRIVKFSKDGKYLSEFGKPGSGPREFYDVHGIALDHKLRRMYINDRGNSRIQVLDFDGKFITEWPHILAPYCIRLTADGKYVWVSDGFTQKFLKYDTDGHLLTSWGTFGIAPGTHWGPHYFDTDTEGNLYVGYDYRGDVQKFRPKKNPTHPDQLVGQLAK
jgi:peptidylamidoglycolate lyase